MTQASLSEYAANTTDFPPVGRDDYGPTMRRPIPDAERARLRDAPEVPIDVRALAGTGLAPSDFEIINGRCSPSTARELGYHPDDEHRERHYPDAEEAAIAADLAEQRAHDDGGGEPKLPDSSGIGGGRRRTLAAIERKERLEPIDGFESVDELVAAVREIQLDSPRYLTPPESVIETIRRVHDGLPADARGHYVRDRMLRRRVNAARRHFNDWLGRLRREKRIPSPVEAGPSNYPAEKARKTSRYEREAKAELDEKLRKTEAGARGARGRALEAIGSSVAEQNEQQREAQREQRRGELEPGTIVKFRNPTLRVGEVIRVNEKSVRVRYPNERAGGTKPLSDEPEPDYCRARVNLDSDFLAVLTETKLDELDVEHVTLAEIRADLFGEDEEAR